MYAGVEQALPIILAMICNAIRKMQNYFGGQTQKEDGNVDESG
jgi:hypothetical protein